VSVFVSGTGIVEPFLDIHFTPKLRKSDKGNTTGENKIKGNVVGKFENQEKRSNNE